LKSPNKNHEQNSNMRGVVKNKEFVRAATLRGHSKSSLLSPPENQLTYKVQYKSYKKNSKGG
jgi:hypothetical protein